MVWGRSARVILKPDQLRGVEDGGHHKLVLDEGVVVILLGDHNPEVQDVSNNVSPGPALDQVSQPSTEKDSHGPGILGIVQLPGQLQLLDSGTRDSEPVNVEWVRWTPGCAPPGCVDVVQVVVPDQDVQSLVWPDHVGHSAGGAHVLHILLAVLHPLHDSNLTRRVVTVVHWAGDEWWRLVVAADVASRTTWMRHTGLRDTGLLVCTVLGHGEGTSGSGFRATISEIINNGIPLIKLFRCIIFNKYILQVRYIRFN